MGYEITVLKNGIRVVAAPMKERRSVAIGIWVAVGGRSEDRDLSGVSHFLEHLLFKGTRSRTANQIKEAIEGVGGSMNAFTSEECTTYLAKVPKKHFEGVFEVLSDMALNASLDEKDIEKERMVILEEIKMTQDQPSQLVDELLAEILWPNHPLGRPLTGSFDTMKNMTRKKLAEFKERYYRPCLMTVAAAGDISQEALVGSVGRCLGEAGQTVRMNPELFVITQTKPEIRLFSKDTEQTHLALAVHALPRHHPDEYAQDLLHIILGGNMSSRLFNEIREERGLAYDIGSSVRKFQETGAFFVEAGVDSSKFKEALDVILKVLSRTAAECVTDGELLRAKEFCLGQFELALESGTHQMLWIGESVVTQGRVRTPEEVTEGIRKVTPDDIRRVARMIFKTKVLNIAIIGPKPEKDQVAEIAYFREV